MYLQWLIDLAGDAVVLAAGGLLIGMLFGACAQSSQFCLRSAVIEFSHALPGSKFAIWLLVFSAVGLAVAAGWLFTYRVSQTSFNLVQVKSISFIGPSADTLMGLINSPSLQLGFDIGLVPGVFAGSLFAALLACEWKMQGFKDGPSMGRYLFGAALMGFGGMLAGGCAVGAGVTGGAIFALTSWMALAAMWAGALLTNYLVDERAAASVDSRDTVSVS